MLAIDADRPVRKAPGGRLLDRIRQVEISPLERAMRQLGLALLAIAAALYLDSWAYQASASFALEMERLGRKERGFGAGASRTYARGESIGWVEIPRLGIEAVVAHGDDRVTLSRAVGHIPGTAVPGDDGNVGLAGHRDTFFRSLEDVKSGDLIQLTTPRERRQYYVVSVSIVPPDRVDVLRPGQYSSVTLVTCYPFDYIGTAPYRFVVRAGERFVPRDPSVVFSPRRGEPAYSGRTPPSLESSISFEKERM